MSEFLPSCKQKCLTSKYEDPFNSLGADVTSQTERHHVDIWRFCVLCKNY